MSDLFKWNIEGNHHVLDLKYRLGVFTISVYPTPNTFDNKQFPWTMDASYYATHRPEDDTTFGFKMSFRQFLREDKLEEAKAKAVFAVQGMLLSGLCRINRYYDKPALDGTDLLQPTWMDYE